MAHIDYLTVNSLNIVDHISFTFRFFFGSGAVIKNTMRKNKRLNSFYFTKTKITIQEDYHSNVKLILTYVINDKTISESLSKQIIFGHNKFSITLVFLYN